MSLKNRMKNLRICGNCVYAGRRLKPSEIQKLRGKAHLKQRYFPYLVYLRRYANPWRDEKVLCRKEKIKVSLLDEACAFWRPHHQLASTARIS